MNPVTRLEQHEAATFGERAADWVSEFYGSWRFILGQNAFYFLWGSLNALVIFRWHWDPYPFVAMNLVMSWVASNSGSFIQQSNNRQAKRDRMMAAKDDEEIGLLLKLQRDQMRSHDWQTTALRLLLRRADIDLPPPTDRPLKVVR
ncbi:MAG: DUF1003 domain-containing protein [Patescibacteria group bacterium]|nr:DUF1003 domain-containing protein [Patescibacteria group bacterium]